MLLHDFPVKSWTTPTAQRRLTFRLWGHCLEKSQARINGAGVQGIDGDVQLDAFNRPVAMLLWV